MERGRSVHREPATGPSELSPGGTPASPSIANARIRFAPLPLIRPRAYSTGRNVYLSDAPDVAEGTLGDGAERTWVRRERDEDFLVDDNDGLNLTDSDEEDGGKGLFGSWGGGSGSAFKGRKDDDSGLSSKLLRPLTFGLGGRKKSSKRSPSADSRASGTGTTLSRTSSMESDAGKIGHDLSRVSSTTSSNGAVPFKSSGVPLRKASTWEPGEKRKPRPVYPSVAQKSRNRASIDVPKLKADPHAPAFNEWGNGPSVGSVGQGPTTEDADDGSGMAWIKKRRLQREAEAKAKVEEEAAKAKDDQTATAASTATPSPVVSGASTPTAPAASGLTLLRPSVPPLVITSPASPSPNSESLAFEFDDLRSGPRSAPPTVDTFSESDKSTVRTKDSGASTEPTSDDEDELDESEDEEDEEEEDQEDDDDDLDADELAAEEALAAAAKQSEMIKGTGQERFHSANHETKMLAVSSKDSSATVKARSASGRSQH